MKKNRILNVIDTQISICELNSEDYISITDMAKYKDDDSRGADVIKNWLRNRSTIEFLGVWESINNPNFNYVEFDHFRKSSGLHTFVLSVSQWVEKTNAIGICAKSGRYGGTYAHKDIAFEFGSAISPEFKLYLIKEFQRLKEEESNINNIEWNVRRMLAATNYRVHTDAIKDELIPWAYMKNKPDKLVYADEAELINLALFGITSKKWREEYPEETNHCKTLRDCADTNQLIVLSNLESMNAMLIRSGTKDAEKRYEILRSEAEQQLTSLNKLNKDYSDIISPNKKKVIEQQAHTNTEPIINQETSQMAFGDALKKISKAGKPSKD